MHSMENKSKVLALILSCASFVCTSSLPVQAQSVASGSFVHRDQVKQLRARLSCATYPLASGNQGGRCQLTIDMMWNANGHTATRPGLCVMASQTWSNIPMYSNAGSDSWVTVFPFKDLGDDNLRLRFRFSAGSVSDFSITNESQHRTTNFTPGDWRGFNVSACANVSFESSFMRYDENARTWQPGW